MSNSYPPDWDKRRKTVYKRDNYNCQNCGRDCNKNDIQLHAHHIVPKSKGGTHNTSNLISLCEDCHNSIHNNRYAPTAGYNRRDNLSGVGDNGENIVSTQNQSGSQNIVKLIEEYSEINNVTESILQDIKIFKQDTTDALVDDIGELPMSSDGVQFDLLKRTNALNKEVGRLKLKTDANKEELNELAGGSHKVMIDYCNTIISICELFSEVYEYAEQRNFNCEEPTEELVDIFKRLAKQTERRMKVGNSLQRKVTVISQEI